MIAAMPEEIAPLLRRVGNYQKEMAAGRRLYRFQLGEVQVVLIESGMGPKKSGAATEALISLAKPAALLNFGFGGAVLPGLEVGELALAERVLLLEDGRLTEAPLPDARLSELMAATCGSAGISVNRATFVTAAKIMNKKEVGGMLGGSMVNPVLEMETAAIFSTAARAGVPAVAVRAISDAAHEELGFSLEEFCDADLNISILRVLGCVVRKPWIIPQLIKLAGNTKKAGESLARCVEAIGRGVRL
jgi:adenosylhomocysteine nucleosidase